MSAPLSLLALLVLAVAFAIGYLAGRRHRRGDLSPAPQPSAQAGEAPEATAPPEATPAAEYAALRTENARLADELAAARSDAARYRQLLLDLEENAPPPLFGPGAPDDLKLIVGVGPVLERMLHQLGVTTYRQIARWTERDIDEFDAKLPEFPGRIRRDGWVTQARELHQSKYGETLPPRGR